MYIYIWYELFGLKYLNGAEEICEGNIQFLPIAYYTTTYKT